MHDQIKYFSLYPLMNKLRLVITECVRCPEDKQQCYAGAKIAFRSKCEFCGAPGHGVKYCGVKKQLKASIDVVTGSKNFWPILEKKMSTETQKMNARKRIMLTEHKAAIDIFRMNMVSGVDW